VRCRRYEIFNDVLTPAISRMIAVHEEQRHTRRFWRFTAVVTALVIAVLVHVAWSAFLWGKESASKAAAKSHQFAAKADAELAWDPQLSVQLALKALDAQDTPQAEAALRGALPLVQEMQSFSVGATVGPVFDPVDANKVLVANPRGVALIWDVKTGHHVASFLMRVSRRGTGATSAVFNSGGTEVAVGYDNGVALFDARSGEMLHSISAERADALQFVGRTGELAIATQGGVEVCLPPYALISCHMLSEAPAKSIAVDPHNPRELAVNGANHTESIWTISGSGRLLRQLDLPRRVHFSADFSPDGSEVATADADGVVRIYRLPALSLVMTLPAGEQVASSVAFSPDGKLIAAGYSSGKARIWDASTRLPLAVLAGSTVDMEAVNFSPDNRQVVTVGDDGTARVWDARPPELRTAFPTSFTGGAPDFVDEASYIGHGSRVFALGASGFGYVLTAGGKRLAVINPGSGIVGTAWNQAGTRIVTADRSGTVDVWQAIGAHFARIHLRTPIRFRKLVHERPRSGPVDELSMSGDGSRIAVVTPDDRTIQVRSAQTGQLLQTLSSDQVISVVAFSPKGPQILAGNNSGQVEAWNLSSGNRVLGESGVPIMDAEYDSRGREFVTVTEDGSVTLWDARDGRQLRHFGTCQVPYRASLSPGDREVAVTCEDGSVSVYDAATGQLLTKLPAINGEVNWAASFSPDGKSIITDVDYGHSAGGVQIWNSELANSSLPAVERLARRLVNP
jgi:WD40 repeat protein